MSIPTEQVGSLPRPMKLQDTIAAYDAGDATHDQLLAEQDAACKDSIERMEATGSPIISGVSSRMFVRSCTITRSSLCRDQASCP